MKKTLIICITLAISAFINNMTVAAEHPTSTEKMMKQQSEKVMPEGEKLFMQHCAACHKGGSNIINPAKTLHKEDLDEFGIKSTKDIIRLMRKPGKGMTKFDTSTIPDKDAKKIAEYILKTF